MNLTVLGSSSSGNCYLLQNETEALVVEAGLPFMEVKKALDFNIRKIAGVIVSHSHTDHAKYAKEFEKAGIYVWKPYEDFCKEINLGHFKIKAFDLVHNVPCFGFYITHQELGKLVYASDTEYVKYRFRGLNHILIECNYSKRFIQDDAVNRSHILEGHMELQTTKEFLRVNNNSDLMNVLLLHLSLANGDPVGFKAEAEDVVSYPTKVWVARKGLEIDLRLEPF